MAGDNISITYLHGVGNGHPCLRLNHKCNAQGSRVCRIADNHEDPSFITWIARNIVSDGYKFCLRSLQGNSKRCCILQSDGNYITCASEINNIF